MKKNAGNGNSLSDYLASVDCLTLAGELERSLGSFYNKNEERTDPDRCFDCWIGRVLARHADGEKAKQWIRKDLVTAIKAIINSLLDPSGTNDDDAYLAMSFKAAPLRPQGWVLAILDGSDRMPAARDIIVNQFVPRLDRAKAILVKRRYA